MSTISVKSSRVRPSTNAIGINTQIVVSVEAAIAPPTCLAPDTADLTVDSPSARRRYVFSITTTELSTSMPTDIERPESDMMLTETPVKYMSVNAKSRLIGIEQSVMTVGRQSRRKRKRMTTEKSAPQRRLERIESRRR